MEYSNLTIIQKIKFEINLREKLRPKSQFLWSFELFKFKDICPALANKISAERVSLANSWRAHTREINRLKRKLKNETVFKQVSL